MVIFFDFKVYFITCSVEKFHHSSISLLLLLFANSAIRSRLWSITVWLLIFHYMQ